MANALKKILLVDDSPFMLAMLASAFEKESFIVIKAASAVEALSILGSHQTDIILSDYEMPKMNGFDFRQKLLQNPATKDIPFVFLTTHKENELVMRGLSELQAVDFINKDTPLPVIISKLDNLLSTVRQKQAHAVDELRKAAEAINVKSIPVKAPAFKNFEVNFWHQPYHGYPGGDFIDFIKINDKYTYIILGDVMGKKWIAWFFTFSYLSYIRASVRYLVLDGKTEPAYILQKINQVICKDEVLKDVLSGLSLLLVDEQLNTVSYAGAGDVPLLYYKAAEDELTTVKTDGLLLGLFNDAAYTAQTITMKSGDRLLVFSDGVIDFTTDNGKRKSDYELFKRNIHPYLKMDRSFTLVRSYLQGLLKSDTQADDCSVISIAKK